MKKLLLEKFDAFEYQYSCKLPDLYKSYITEYLTSNNDKKFEILKKNSIVFTFPRKTIRTIDVLLSFNKDERKNMWDYNSYHSQILEYKYIVFAITKEGGLFCINKTKGTVVYYDIKTEKIEFIAKNFANFVELLQ